MRFRWFTVLGTSLAFTACGGGEETVQPDSQAGGSGQPATLLELSGVSGSKGSLARHTFGVPAGALRLTVATEGGSGNVDIAVLGPGARDCESASAGNTEHCELTAPVQGGWQVGLLGTDDYSDVALKVTVTVPGTPPAAGLDPPPVANPPVATPPPTPPVPVPAPATPPATEPPVSTPAPSTPTPSTPAPSSPAPSTPAPSTPAPSTPAPSTPAPSTPAPTTPAPSTPAPSTPAPTPPPPATPPPTTPPPVTPAPEPPAPEEPPPEPPPPPEPEPPPVSGGESPPATAAITALHADATLPSGFVAAGNRVFFVSTSGNAASRRLWITDGTPGGTRRLHADLQPSALMALGNGVVFTAREPGGNQHALWHASTSGAVRMLRSFGARNAEPSLVGVYGTRLFFIADDGIHGRELWSSDGTSAGTHLVSDIGTNGDARFEATQAWTWFNGRLYFVASSGRRDAAQLHATNGSAGDLQQLTFGTVEPRDFSSHDMTAYGGRLYFTWHSRDDGVELWSTDGSMAGTQPFFDALPGRDRSGSPRNFNVVGGRLLFFAYYPGARAPGLFASNGTASGTARISTVEMSSETPRMVQVDGRHLFAGRRAWTGGYTLWATDGTAGGTVEVSGQVSPAAALFNAGGTALLGNRLVFLGGDAAGYEPWVTDGTRAGTRRLGDVNRGAGSSFDPRLDQGWIAARAGRAYFTAGVSSGDFRLFETDGTVQGTQQLSPADATVRANTRGDGRTPLAAPFASGNRLLFGARFYSDGRAVLFGM